MLYNQGMGVPSSNSPEANAVQNTDAAASVVAAASEASTAARFNSDLSYRAQLLLRATPRVPLTQEGLPVGFYRADLLPNVAPATSLEEIQSIRNAYSDLSFEFGYPTLPDGRPFWHKLDFEPGFAYGAFQIYLESIDRGPRELHALSDDKELRVLATKMYCSPLELDELPVDPDTGQRLIQPSRLHKIIYEFSILHFWRWRSKSYDIYKEAAYRHTKLKRQITVEDKHYGMANRLMKQLHEKVINAGDGFWDGMSAKTAVDLLKALVSIERISVGLPAQGPLSQKETPEDMTFEMIMRTLGQKTNQGNIYENGGAQAQGRQILSDVLADPQAAANMQELIVRITRSTQQSLPNPTEVVAARSFKGRDRKVEIINAEDLTAGMDISGAPGENLDILQEEGEGGGEGVKAS